MDDSQDCASIAASHGKNVNKRRQDIDKKCLGIKKVPGEMIN